MASLLCSPQVFAAEDYSITVDYYVDDIHLIGAQFDLYLVATMDEYGVITTLDSFIEYNDDIELLAQDYDTKEDDVMKLTSLLDTYIGANSDTIKPIDSGKTDQNGYLKFPTGENELVGGLYFIKGGSITQGGYIYDAVPFIMFLPMYEASATLHNVTVYPKDYSRRVPEPGTSGDTPQEPDEPTPQSSTPPTTPQTLSGDVEISHDVPLTAEALPTLSGSLPQTGQLWWPIPVLIFSGLVLIIIGLMRRRVFEDVQ
jgi:hypothetical protein